MPVQTRSDLSPEATERARRTLLHVAAALGDGDDLAVLIGGLTPQLLVSPASLPEGVDPHPGTLDVDLVLSYAVLDEERYQGLEARLRDAGFAPIRNDAGLPTRWRWSHDDGAGAVIEFLIDNGRVRKKAGALQPLTEDLAAAAFPCLDLAFQAPAFVRLEGRNLHGDTDARTIRVCNPAAFVALKALALRGRAKDKDAYDLVYVLQHYTAPDGHRGPEAVAALWPTLSGNAAVATDALKASFGAVTAPGPRAAARFVDGLESEDQTTAAFDTVQTFLALTARPRARRS